MLKATLVSVLMMASSLLSITTFATEVEAEAQPLTLTCSLSVLHTVPPHSGGNVAYDRKAVVLKDTGPDFVSDGSVQLTTTFKNINTGVLITVQATANAKLRASGGASIHTQLQYLGYNNEQFGLNDMTSRTSGGVFPFISADIHCSVQ
jgi:hypothetical protein